jgi:hypothetical protein
MMDTNSSSSIAERLAAVQAISELKARYFRLMDTKQWGEWRQVFAPDAQMDMSGEAASLRSMGFELPENVSLTWRGAENIGAAVSAALENVTTVHHGHMPEIEVLSGTRARGIWAMEDVVLYGAGAPVAGFRGYGHYFESYTKFEDRWVIQTIRLVRLCVRAICLAAEG